MSEEDKDTAGWWFGMSHPSAGSLVTGQVLHHLEVTHIFLLNNSLCMQPLWWRVVICSRECVALMVILLMQVAQRRKERSSLTGAWGREGQPPSTASPWAHSVMKWPVMEALSKQWFYSTWRGVSVRTGQNTIPPNEGCTFSASCNLNHCW